MDDEVVLIGEDGAPFFDRHRPVAFYVHEPIWPNNHIHILKARDDVHAPWLAYALNDVDYSLYITGATRDKLTQSAMMTIQLPTPSRDMQRAIADYLDRETAQIDTLITKQEALIEMLRERRRSTITQATTRGIDEADLVDSANPYLGQMPHNWRATTFRRHVHVNNGQVDPREEPWSQMVLIAPNHIERDTGKILGLELASEQGADSGKYVVEPGQVIYSKIRPELNKVTLAPQACLCSADMYALTADSSISNRYLAYLMLARPFHRFATMMSMRVKMPKINREEIADAPMAIPPLAEQHRIVQFLDAHLEQIDTLISKAQRFVHLARERRAALITAAVIGKIDVRERVG